MNKRRAAAAAAVIAAFLLAASWAFAAGAPAAAPEAPAADADSADVVVLLDISQSALPYFQDVTDYVVSSVVEDYLRLGDTFHLLSFGETTQVEIAQRISAEADVKAVLGRLYLLYPLARYTDFVGALGYLYQYVADLPENRRKVIVVITDGVHNPPPSSPTFGATTEQAAAEIEATAARIRANGWPVSIIKLPFPKVGEPGAPAATSAEAQGKSLLDVAAKALSAEVSDFSSAGKADLARRSLSLPAAEFPGPLGKRDYAFSFPLKITNGSETPVGLELDRVRLGDADILAKKVFLTVQGGRSGTMDIPVLVPDTVPQGEAKLGVSLHFANGVRVSPDSGTLDLTLARSPVAALLRSGGRIVLFAIVLALGLCAILGMVLVLRRVPKRAEAPIAAAVLQSGTGDAAVAAPARAEVVAASAPAASASGRPATRRPAAARAEDGRAEEGRVAAQALAAAATGSEQSRQSRPVLAAAPMTASADDDAMALSADASAKEIAASLKVAADRSAALLAEAARANRASAGAAPSSGIVKTPDAHDEMAASSAAVLLAEKKAESARTVAILAEAAGRRAPPLKSAPRAFAPYASRVVKPGSITIELLVADQNPHIGTRNVRAIPAGGSKSVGGGSSDFLVFLVSVPKRVAELHFDGERLVFVPLRGELFPDLQGPVEDCIGKDIRMVSRSGYPLILRFDAYERPADKVNRLLHCIDSPGLL
jgi:hypothetical protein